MAGIVVHGDVFEKAQDRAREERLKTAIERETAAHRSLCVHYNAAIERIAELEDTESGKIAELEGVVKGNSKEILRLKSMVKIYKSVIGALCIVFICVSLMFFLFTEGLI